MPTVEDRLATLEAWMKTSKPQLLRATSIGNALEGRQSDATLTLPHNDSWIFEDNVDGTHPANLRYLIASNITRVVSARLSIFLAPYRTYSNFSVTSTGTESSGHNHSHNHGSHAHNMFNTSGAGGASAYNLGMLDGGGFSISVTGPIGFAGTVATAGTTPATDSTAESGTHTHTVSGSSFNGVTEAASPTGITVSFDGVDQTAALGGPFSTDQIELNVRPFLALTPAVKHTIAMQPTGLGRIEAHLRLGVYVSAGQLI